MAQHRTSITPVHTNGKVCTHTAGCADVSGYQLRCSCGRLRHIAKTEQPLEGLRKEHLDEQRHQPPPA